jgi:hypothetical protein
MGTDGYDPVTGQPRARSSSATFSSARSLVGDLVGSVDVEQGLLRDVFGLDKYKNPGNLTWSYTTTHWCGVNVSGASEEVVRLAFRDDIDAPAPGWDQFGPREFGAQLPSHELPSLPVNYRELQ